MMRKHFTQTRRRLLSANKWKFRLAFWLAAIAVGLVAAGFALLSNAADHFYHELYDNSPYIAYILTPVGLAFIAWLTKKYFPGTEGSGIPQAIAAISMKHHGLRARVLSIRIAIAKIGLTCMGLFCGASIGREAPPVHIGASIMHSLRHFKFFRGQDMTRGLILAGGAAGISAAFNTPLAGIMFAIEEMSRSYEDKTTGTLLIAVIIAGVTALAVLGNYTYFGSTSVSLTFSQVWPAVLACGIAGGLLGGLFSMSLVHGSRKVAPLISSYPVRVAFICGLVLSLIGFLSGGSTYGTGYEEAKQLMAGQEAIAGFSIYKLLATVASYLSGIPGGIFAPSLSVGAGMGADMAGLFTDIPIAGIILLGMVGYFTGVVQTPITAFIIVMEMNDTPSMILPLMATALLAKGVSHLVCPQPIYQALAEAYLHKAEHIVEEKTIHPETK